MPPKVLLDTQIISEAERGDISHEQWESVVCYLRQATRYCVSSLTICELQIGLANGADEHFEMHQRRLRLLVPSGMHPEVFDFTPYFLAEKLGLTIQRPAHLEDDFLGVIEMILAAPSKAALLSGFLFNSHQTARIRLDKFSQEMRETKESYQSAMAHLQRLNIREGRTPELWTTNLLAFYGISGFSKQAKVEIADRLSAVYEFEIAVLRLLENANFDITKHASDQIDGQQLCYLCDPDTVFITKDSGFKLRTSTSSQTSRIKTFRELLAHAHNRSPLLD